MASTGNPINTPGKSDEHQATTSGNTVTQETSEASGSQFARSSIASTSHSDYHYGSEDLDAARRRGQGEYGCSHYQRRCKMVAPCCDEVFWCRHCHNEVKSQNEKDPMKCHELERTQVTELVCALCNTRQKVGESCCHCRVSFGQYACQECRFFDDDLTKEQFHCEGCGICRVGGRDNFFHCYKCGCCFSTIMKDNHICIENSLRQNCPICFEYLFDSIRAPSILKCGHAVHSDCLESMQQNRQLACPICMKSYTNLDSWWRRLDEDIASIQMPEEYAGWQVDILCNDCNGSGRVAFHIVGHKCPHCGSYNTRRLSLIRPDVPSDQQQ